MSSSIRNIYAVLRNYRKHAEELGNDVPHAPILFSMPTHALVPLDGSAVVLPAGIGVIHYEIEIVLRFDERGQPDGIALGLDLTARDVQSELKKNAYPWLAAKGFRNSAPISDFHPFPGYDQLPGMEFSLRKNGEQVQLGRPTLMIFDAQTIATYCASYFGLGQGDIIFTGTPEGVGPIADGDHLELFMNGDSWGSCTIRLQ